MRSSLSIWLVIIKFHFCKIYPFSFFVHILYIKAPSRERSSYTRRSRPFCLAINRDFGPVCLTKPATTEDDHSPPIFLTSRRLSEDS